jgi:hypothetical protein
LKNKKSPIESMTSFKLHFEGVLIIFFNYFQKIRNLRKILHINVLKLKKSKNKIKMKKKSLRWGY